MLHIGAHVSISGGVANAVDRERDLNGTVGQIFVGSPRGWAVSDLDPDDAAEFKSQTTDHDMGPWIVHGTYLVNFATPKDDLAEKSINTVQAELDACDTLDIPYYVFHPGSHTGAGVTQGTENVGHRLSELEIPDSTTVLLENTTGKGTSLGQTFDQLNEMVAASEYTYDDLGVCLDSCHLYAGGYDFTTQDEIDEMITEFDDVVGLENLHYLHLNDSKHPFDSEKDEHEHIGDGEIGDDGFELLLNHDDLRDLPMVLETPTNGKGYEWNIEKVRSLYID